MRRATATAMAAHIQAYPRAVWSGTTPGARACHRCAVVACAGFSGTRRADRRGASGQSDPGERPRQFAAGTGACVRTFRFNAISAGDWPAAPSASNRTPAARGRAVMRASSAFTTPAWACITTLIWRGGNQRALEAPAARADYRRLNGMLRALRWLATSRPLPSPVRALPRNWTQPQTSCVRRTSSCA